MAVLSWRSQNGGEERQLKERTIIGRSPVSDIQLADPTVSWVHAQIVHSNGDWILEDEHSANGCFVNGERRRRSALREGDVMRFGSVEMIFSPRLGEDPDSESRRCEEGSTIHLGVENVRRLLQDDSGFAQVATASSVFVAEPETGADDDPRTMAQRLRVSYEISKATAETLDLPRVLDRVLAALFEIFETAERSFVLLVDSQTNEVSVAAVKRRVSENMGKIPISRSALDHAMRNREAVLCRDAMTDARYAQAQSVVDLGIRSMMIAPLVFREQVLGAIQVDTRRAAGQFSQSDLELLAVAAGQAAACVVNARLHAELLASARLAAVGQTVASLTHCVKNILQGVQGGSFIIDKALNAGQLQGVQVGWEMVKRNNALMEELVFDLLSYSKERLPEYEPSDLNALCREVCQITLSAAQTKGVLVSFNPDQDLGLVELDPKGIRRCVLNLITNALDACSGNGGTVTVETRRLIDDGFVRCFVRDTGCEMSEQTKAKLFAVFFSTKGSKGTGLGLPVSRKIVEEHGGRLEVESEQGKGTTFTICLPATRGQAPLGGSKT